MPVELLIISFDFIAPLFYIRVAFLALLAQFVLVEK